MADVKNTIFFTLCSTIFIGALLAVSSYRRFSAFTQVIILHILPLWVQI